MECVNDYIIAYKTPTGERHTISKWLHGDGDRICEALRGQGCRVHVWSKEMWQRGYKRVFYFADWLL